MFRAAKHRAPIFLVFPEKYNEALDTSVIYNRFLFMSFKGTQFCIRHECLIS